MIRSMTAFGRAEAKGDWGSLVWEVRSVNHRYLEIFPRLPDEFRALEAKVREHVRSVLNRGKVEVGLRFSPRAGGSGERVLNDEFARHLIASCQKLERMMSEPARFNALDLMRWPGVLSEASSDFEALQAEALVALDAALDQLKANRESEGARLKEMIVIRLDAMAPLVEQARTRMPAVVTANRSRLREKLAELLDKIGEDRVEQEMVLQAQRMDVDEEMDRLNSHIAELRDVLSRDEPVGRRMDFLMQEFNREANTLGSKSVDKEITGLAVELKVLIEQMREQIQNIE